jgi:UDP-N-acetylglucosamine 2-epimerase (non-hydrolysing)
MTVFGTRPEVIKLAPVINALNLHGSDLQVVNVASAQHTDLLYPFAQRFGVRLDYDLQAMRPNQTPAQLCARVLESLNPILEEEEPDLVLVQGDTTSALAGALAAFYHQIPVGHVEAGLRSGDPHSPFPEEMNRRLISNLATYHFAPTVSNRDVLLAEGVGPDKIFVTGNPVVDAVHSMSRHWQPSPLVEHVLKMTKDLRRVVLTTHRRESFGEIMQDNLSALRCFIERNRDTALIFPVHPNPAVTEAADEILSNHPRIYLLDPLSYEDFLTLLGQAWLIVSDSGGVQEEAPSLGKPLLILRENTERPEAVTSGVARLVGGNPKQLFALLQEAAQPGSWVEKLEEVANPFGRGDAGPRIADTVARLLDVQPKAKPVTTLRELRPTLAPVALVS